MPNQNQEKPKQQTPDLEKQKNNKNNKNTQDNTKKKKFFKPVRKGRKYPNGYESIDFIKKYYEQGVHNYPIYDPTDSPNDISNKKDEYLAREQEVNTYKLLKSQKIPFKEEYAFMLIDHMKKGLSFESFGAVIMVSKDTLYRWVNRYDIWCEAKKAGELLSLKTWEEIGIRGAKGYYKDFNATAYVFNKKNRFGWRDRKEIDSTNKNIYELRGLSDEKVKEALKKDKFLEVVEGEVVDDDDKDKESQKDRSN